MKSAFYQWSAIVLAIALVVALAGVYISRRQPNLSIRCVRALASVAKSEGSTVTSSGDRIWIGGKEVRLRAQIEDEELADTKSLLGLRVDVLLDGILQPFTFGSVGVGNNRDDAVETAISEWSMSVGEALLGALAGRPSTKSQTIGSFLVYPGMTGIRGSPGAVWSAQKDEQLLHHLDTLIQGLEHSPGEFHSILLMIVVRRDGTHDAQCRVDGVISSAGFAAVQSFPWSQGETDYVFKQFYVLRRH